LVLPLLLGWWRCLAGRREAEEAVGQLDDDNKRRKLHKSPDRVLHKAIEAQDKARQQDGSVHIGCQERVIIVEDFDGLRGWKHDGRRFGSRDWLDSRCRAHVGQVAVLMVVRGC
jgi:hypothetical protein